MCYRNKKIIKSLYETKYLDNELNEKLTKLVDYILELLAEIIDKGRYE